MADEKKMEEKRKLVKSYVTADGALVEEFVGPNKPEHTTFVISRATKIDIDLPDVIVSPGLVPNDVTSPEETAGYTGLLNQMKFRYILGKDALDDLFFSISMAAGETDKEHQVLSKYWHVFDNKNDSYLEFPANRTFQAYTRNSWQYPWGGVIAVIPTLAPTGGFWPFGFEPGPGAGWGLIGFKWVNNTFTVHCNGSQRAITSYLPANYDTAAHRYQVKVNQATVEYYIDDDLIAIGIKGDVGAINIAGPPYEILGSGRKGFIEAPAFIERALATEVYQYYLDPRHFTAMSGDAIPPRTYRFYETGTETLFTDSTITALEATITSHPFPIISYQDKTINFRASEQGTLSVEIYKLAGNWREYDTMGITQDKVKTYSIEGEGVLARVVYTPNTYPCTISEAECVLR